MVAVGPELGGSYLSNAHPISETGISTRIKCLIFVAPNVRGHRADEIKDATRRDASEAPPGPRC